MSSNCCICTRRKHAMYTTEPHHTRDSVEIPCSARCQQSMPSPGCHAGSAEGGQCRSCLRTQSQQRPQNVTDSSPASGWREAGTPASLPQPPWPLAVWFPLPPGVLYLTSSTPPPLARRHPCLRLITCAAAQQVGKWVTYAVRAAFAWQQRQRQRGSLMHLPRIAPVQRAAQVPP
jgi:hypothetical protein